jgi:hypothetical protein
MVEEIVTIDSILEWFKESIENKNPISQEQWLDSAAKLVILAEDIDDQLSQMEFQMAERERIALEEGEPAAKAKILKTGVVDYKYYLKLKAKRKRIDEHIRIAKKRERHPDF